MATTTTGPQSSVPQQPDTASGNVACDICGRIFKVRGLGQHKRIAHPVQANQEINVDRTNKHWTNEEVRILARAEAETNGQNNDNINRYLFSLGIIPGRTEESIKGKRRSEIYKSELERQKSNIQSESITATNNAQATNSVANISTLINSNIDTFTNNEQILNTEVTQVTNVSSDETILTELKKDIDEVKAMHRRNYNRNAHALIELGESALRGEAMNEEKFTKYLKELFPNVKPNNGPIHGKITQFTGTRKQIRQQQYAVVQKLYHKNPGSAGRFIFEQGGSNSTTLPEPTRLFTYWKEVFDETQRRNAVPPNITISEAVIPELENVSERRAPGTTSNPVPAASMSRLWIPIGEDEVRASKTREDSAAGPDGIQPAKWNRTHVKYKKLLYNLFIYYRKVPSSLKTSRTVFLPKVEGGSEDPGDFRPLTICSAVLREFNKILAHRLVILHNHDNRQTAYQPMDGVGRNIVITTALLHEARTKRKELHMALLDQSKAFNSLYHSSIKESVQRIGCPQGFVEYITDLYSDAYTTMQFEGKRSRTRVTRGVYQGDPLSGPIFTIGYENGLKALDENIGFEVGLTRFNAGAYSDDGSLYAATRNGLQINLNRHSEETSKDGLKLNPNKSKTLSIVPSGRDKKVKIVTGRPFLVDNIEVTELSISDFWKLLGVEFNSFGPIKPSINISQQLEKLTKAPLKPQQRLHLLKSVLIPKYQDKLVFSRTTAAGLKKIDVTIREFIRRWLKLPHDVPKAFFHASVKDGGLGVVCLQNWIPLMRFQRLSKIRDSGDERIAAVMNTDLYNSIFAKCRQSLAALGQDNPSTADYKKYWKRELNMRVDGKDLEHADAHSTSSSWVSYRSNEISGADYMKYIQIRANCLPTRVRTSRGRPEKVNTCRAGCNSTDSTAQHVIQQCHRTNDVRIRRHNRVVNILDEEFSRNTDNIVHKELNLRTRLGLRKPDLILIKDNELHVLDVQVIKCRTLQQDHNLKVNKYKSEPGFDSFIKKKFKVRNTYYHACTISYKGIWSKHSVKDLIELGVSKYCLFKIATSVLRGTWYCWDTFNHRNNPIHDY